MMPLPTHSPDTSSLGETWKFLLLPNSRCRHAYKGKGGGVWGEGGRQVSEFSAAVVNARTLTGRIMFHMGRQARQKDTWMNVKCHAVYPPKTERERRRHGEGEKDVC